MSIIKDIFSSMGSGNVERVASLVEKLTGIKPTLPPKPEPKPTPEPTPEPKTQPQGESKKVRGDKSGN